MLGNYAGARQIFERWMEWRPGEHAWGAFIRFELRCNEVHIFFFLVPIERLTELVNYICDMLRWNLV